MIEGTRIARRFSRIFASSFMYDQNGVACWPALAVNYTTKTQFLFRINKGVLDVWDNEKINQFVPKEDRPFPFGNILYLGDGATDVPCMKLVRDQGGHSIAVYPPKAKRKHQRARELVKEQRAHFALPADYSAGSLLESVVALIIRRLVADDRLRKAIGSPKLAQRGAEMPPEVSPGQEGDAEKDVVLNAADGPAAYAAGPGSTGASGAVPAPDPDEGTTDRGTNESPS